MELNKYSITTKEICVIYKYPQLEESMMAQNLLEKLKNLIRNNNSSNKKKRLANKFAKVYGDALKDKNGLNDDALGEDL